MSVKTLFISHSAGRTGAPIALLYILQWLKTNTPIEFEVLLREGGTLESQFKSLGSTTVCTPPGPRHGPASKLACLLPNPFAESSRYMRHLTNAYRSRGIRLVYSNTITNGELLSGLSGLDCPVICHVHELDYWIIQCGTRNLQLVKQHTDQYVAASEAVKRNLVEHHGIPSQKIDVVHESIPIVVDPQGHMKRNDVRRALGIPAGALVVGGAGTETWRKGKDLFIQLALLVSKEWQATPIHFVWVGPHQNQQDRYELAHDVRHAGLSPILHFVGEVSNPLDYFSAFDIFAMVSREDPFPLVCLEAAALGKPIVCFGDAGGVPEFVENDAGVVVPYLDVPAMASEVLTLACDRRLREAMGNRGAKKARQRHDIAIAGPQILRVIDSCLS